MQTFPEELVETIFTTFTTSHTSSSTTDPSALAAVCLVCRTWNRIAMPLLYIHLRLNFQPTPDGHPIEITNILAIQQALATNPHLQKQVRTLRITYAGPPESPDDYAEEPHLARSKTWLPLLPLLPKLEHLDLLNYTWLPLPLPRLSSLAPDPPPKITAEHAFLLPLKRLDIAVSAYNYNALPVIFLLPNLEILHLSYDAVQRAIPTATWPEASSNIKELSCTGLQIHSSRSMLAWCSQSLRKMGRACRALEKVRIVLQAKHVMPQRRLYIYTVQSFAEHFVNGALRGFEMVRLGAGEGYEVDDSHSVFHYFAVNGADVGLRLEEVKLDLLCLVGKEGRVDGEGLPGSLRRIGIRIPGRGGGNGGNMHIGLVYDWLESMQGSLRARFPALERVIVETDGTESTLGRFWEVKDRMAMVGVQLISQDAPDIASKLGQKCLE